MSSPDNNATGSALEVAVNKTDLLRELSVTQGIVERKSTIPILSSFLLQGIQNALLITATDLDLSLRTFCPANVRTAGSCTIPARKFYEYVRLLRDGDLTLKLLENNWVQIRSGRSNTKMVGMARDSFPTLPLFPADKTMKLPATVLRTLISRTIFAISEEESRYTLNGALLVLKPGMITMVATDGHRLACIETANNQVTVEGETRVLLARKAMAEVNSLLNSMEIQTVEFAKDDSTLFFRIGTRLLTCRQLTGSFPNYEAVLPNDLNSSLTVPGDELSRSIQRVSQFADGRSNAVRLRMKQNQLLVSSSNSEAGESEETLETTYRGEPVLIGFNARYLLDFLKVCGGQNLSFRFKGPNSPGEFRPDEVTDGAYKYCYIVMPLRV
jgi:DNA polymerase-3 subunit beta